MRSEFELGFGKANMKGENDMGKLKCRNRERRDSSVIIVVNVAL